MEPGVPSLARRLHPKAGPVIVRAADGTRLYTEVFGTRTAIRPLGYPCSRHVGLRRVARRRVPTDTSVDFDAEVIQFAVQRRTGDTEGCCGLHTVPAGLAQCQDDRVSLD